MSKTIHVNSAFDLTIDLNDGLGVRVVKVPAGVSSQTDIVADHWYTQAHLSHGGLGSAEYAQASRDAADAAFVSAKAAVDHYTGLERAAQEAEEAAGLDRVAPAYDRLGGDGMGTRPIFGSDGDDDLDPADARPATTAPAEGSASIAGGEGNDTIPAKPIDTLVAVDEAENSVSGGASNDTVGAGVGNDTLTLEGDDSLPAGAGNDVLAGGGNDSVAATVAADTVAGGASNDAYPGLSAKQETALDRDGDGKPGGAPPGGNRRKGPL